MRLGLPVLPPDWATKMKMSTRLPQIMLMFLHSAEALLRDSHEQKKRDFSIGAVHSPAFEDLLGH